MFKTYKPAGMGDPYGSYVHGIEAPTGSRLIYVSGQIPVRADGSTPEGIEAQAKVCWENIAAILKDAGVGLDSIVRTTQYLVDRSTYPQANSVRAAALGKHRTASVAIFVAGLVEPAWLIEIDAIAAIPA